MWRLVVAAVALLLVGCQPAAQLTPTHTPVDLQHDSRPEILACTDASAAQDWPKAILLCGQALRITALSVRDKAALYVLRGKAYGFNDDNEPALVDFNASIALDPDDVRAYAGRATIYNNMDRYTDAAADADRAIRMQPDLAAAYVSRARAHSALGGSFDSVIVDQNEAIRLDPKSAIAYNNRAAVYSGVGQIDHALADLDKALQLDPKLVVAYQNRGLIRVYLGDSERGLQDLNQAVSLAPQRASPYFHRAMGYTKTGDRTRALADLQQAIRLDPDKSSYYVLRAELHLDNDDKAAANLDCREALSRDRTHSPMVGYTVSAPSVVCASDGPHRVAADDAPDNTPSEYRVHPDEIEAKPGQYTGYLDWNAKQAFTAKGLTPEEMTAVVSCTNAALYHHMTAVEQAKLDNAARGNGMSAEDLTAFWHSVSDRLGRDQVMRITDAACHEQNKALSKLFDKP
jgi:tetratricopeptide (TPR) repeat protein